MAKDEIAQLPYNHPLFFRDSDGPDIALISLKLTGPKNYALWSRAMRVALLVKNKLWFVDGTCVKKSYKGELETQWERCNAVVVSWLSSIVASESVPSIMYTSSAKKVCDEFKERFDKDNLTRIYQFWTEIASLQGTESVTSYFSKMKDLWDELDILAPLPSCDCEKSRPYVEHLVRQRLLQFLMGLNESYSQVRSNILEKRPVLSVNQAYAVAVQEESQRTLGVVETNKEPLTMLAGRVHVKPLFYKPHLTLLL
ncbi:uncharacterized protein [Nicotiana sylvestris]|uniref:uncharacterized protein n=1 Tax=Nicotiana sylvestris TaxID=4096 RepID=UPI00388CBFB8